MMLSPRTTFAALVTCSLCLASAPLGMAAEDHIYSGANCAPSPSDNIDSDISQNSGGTWNIDPTYSRSVYCGIDRENTTNTNGLDSAYVAVDDSSGTRGFSCTMYSYDKYGDLEDSSTVTTTGTYQGETTLSFGSTINISAAGGYYVLRCSIPNSFSRVISYRVEEF